MIKPLFDRIVGLLGIIGLSPIFILLMVVLSVHFRGNPFFKQDRVGKDDHIFKIFKFRTMNFKKSALGELLSDADRTTSIGRFVRKFSLDELPQLWNMLRGEMSLVGPRPLLVEYLPLYNSEQRKRHKVKPGITGLAQVNGRNQITWKEKFDFDIKYVNKQSVKLDLFIVFLTLKKIIQPNDINGLNGEVEKFKGNN